MFAESKSILVIQTGGTIDKCYPRSVGGYAFEIGECAAKRVLDRIRPPYIVDYETVCRRDSQDIGSDDRNALLLCIRRTLHRRILITHGTDAMILTAQFLGPRIRDKLVILTGSRLPESFKDSDADFNLGMSVGALQASAVCGVYVAMGARLHLWSEVSRDMETGRFMGKL